MMAPSGGAHRRNGFKHPQLCGRAAELRALTDTLERTARGSATVALIEGEAGIGKSRLVQEASLRARELGFVVLAGAADELDRVRPFASLIAALELVPAAAAAERTELARSLGEPAPTATRLWATRPVGGLGLDQRVLESITALLTRLATDRPVALVVEDLHWADTSTLLTLRALRRRLAELPVALLLSRRSHPEAAELGALLEELERRRALRIRLGPLGAEAIGQLARSALGRPPGRRLSEQLAGAAGNPLFAVELLRALVEDGTLTLTENEAEIEAPEYPASLRGALLHSLRHLSRESLQLMRLASLLGAEFRAADLGLVSGLGAIHLSTSLQEALDAGVLESAPSGRLSFRHPLLREIIYADLVPSVRSALHLQAGRALASAGAPPLTIAGQVALGAEPGDGQAVGWLRQAAEEALPRSPKAAMELARRALSIAEPGDPARGDILMVLVDALLWAGTVHEAEAVIREALEDVFIDAGRKARLRLPLGWAQLSAGRPDQALDTLEAALETSGEDDAAPLMVAASYARLYRGDVRGAADSATAAVAAGRPLGAEPSVVPALCLLSQIARLEGRTTESIALARQALEGADRLGAEATRWPSDFALASALIDADDFEGAGMALRRGLRHSRAIGGTCNLPLYHWRSAELLYLGGAWDDALLEVEAGFRTAAEAGVAFRGCLDALAWRAIIALNRDDLAGSEAALRAAAPELDRQGIQLGAEQLLRARALVAEARGRRTEALETLGQAWEVSAMVTRPVLGPSLVRLLILSGRSGQALRRAAEVEEVAEAIGSPWARAAALRCRGLATQRPEPLVTATGLLREVRRPRELAAACEQAGELLAGRHRAYAVVMLDEALSGFDALGALRPAARVRATLRTMGVRRGHRSSGRPRRAMGWQSLTPAELRVARMVLDGLTSPEIAGRTFVSRRTVETHVAHVFNKLGVRSRSELRAAAAALQGSVSAADAGVPVPALSAR